jgi:hypothetical protein
MNSKAIICKTVDSIHTFQSRIHRCYPVTKAINLPLDITGGKRVKLISDNQLVKKGFTPCKSNPCTGPDRPLGLQEVDTPRISRKRQTKMVS